MRQCSIFGVLWTYSVLNMLQSRDMTDQIPERITTIALERHHSKTRTKTWVAYSNSHQPCEQIQGTQTPLKVYPRVPLQMHLWCSLTLTWQRYNIMRMYICPVDLLSVLNMLQSRDMTDQTYSRENYNHSKTRTKTRVVYGNSHQPFKEQKLHQRYVLAYLCSISDWYNHSGSRRSRKA